MVHWQKYLLICMYYLLKKKKESFRRNFIVRATDEEVKAYADL